MEAWLTAAEAFLDGWRDRPEVVGAVVCGSFVTGYADAHSDVDIHIVLSDGVDWRERGNEMRDGFLIEYFANPGYRIALYMEEDYADNTSMAATQFATGVVLFDKDGSVARIVDHARDWISKPFREFMEPEINLAKYSLWDALDNLMSASARRSPDIHAVYHSALGKLYSTYARYLRQPVLSVSSLHMYLSDPRQAEARYMLKPFADDRFAAMMVAAIEETGTSQMVERASDLTSYTLQRMGGFNIDGWKHRSSAG